MKLRGDEIYPLAGNFQGMFIARGYTLKQLVAAQYQFSGQSHQRIKETHMNTEAGLGLRGFDLKAWDRFFLLGLWIRLSLLYKAPCRFRPLCWLRLSRICHNHPFA